MLAQWNEWFRNLVTPEGGVVIALCVLVVIVILRLRRRRGKTPDQLAEWLGVPLTDLETLTPRYRRTEIRKKGGGVRVLDVPDTQTKAMQRRILHRLLRALRAHPAACGFERGKSVVDNARPHVARAVVVRMDVEDFFHATRAQRIESYFGRIGWNRAAASILTRLCCHDGGLPQGAPTSPRLSNLVNYLFDVQMTNFATRRRARYTRYADDITLSFERDVGRHVRGAIQFTRRRLTSIGYTLHQQKKLHIRRPHQRQVVTGLVVNEKIQLPRESRRLLRAIKHRLATGRSLDLSREQIIGMVAWSEMVRKQGGG